MAMATSVTSLTECLPEQESEGMPGTRRSWQMNLLHDHMYKQESNLEAWSEEYSVMPISVGCSRAYLRVLKIRLKP